jgi:hypothetical protein
MLREAFLRIWIIDKDMKTSKERNYKQVGNITRTGGQRYETASKKSQSHLFIKTAPCVVYTWAEDGSKILDRYHPERGARSVQKTICLPVHLALGANQDQACQEDQVYVFPLFHQEP